MVGYKYNLFRHRIILAVGQRMLNIKNHQQILYTLLLNHWLTVAQYIFVIRWHKKFTTVIR